MMPGHPIVNEPEDFGHYRIIFFTVCFFTYMLFMVICPTPIKRLILEAITLIGVQIYRCFTANDDEEEEDEQTRIERLNMRFDPILDLLDHDEPEPGELGPEAAAIARRLQQALEEGGGDNDLYGNTEEPPTRRNPMERGSGDGDQNMRGEEAPPRRNLQGEGAQPRNVQEEAAPQRNMFNIREEEAVHWRNNGLVEPVVHVPLLRYRHRRFRRSYPRYGHSRQNNPRPPAPEN